MLKNYFIVAFRHLTRHKLFSAINVLCLGIGIAFSMLIGNYIMQEKNVNLFLRNAENQYLIKSKWKVNNMGLPITTVAPLAKALKENYPALVENYYRFNPLTNVASADEKHFQVNISICDTSLVTMYGMKLLQGNPHQAFPNNSSAVISRDLAMKLFGTTNAVNKTITVTGTSGKRDFLVSGVLEAMPYNTVNQIVDKTGYDVFVPMEGLSLFGQPNYFDDWNNIYIVGMIELKRGVKPSDLAMPVNQLLNRHLPGNLKGLLQVEFVNLNDYYLNDHNDGAAQQMIGTLFLVAVFILLMAIINFVNISIGTSTYRLKEIGLRKVFGSARKQLIIQYLVESILLTFFATIISLCIYEGMRPFFNQLLNKQIDAIWQFSTAQAGWLLLFVTTLGTIAGLYPALALASANIIHAVKGKIDMARGGLTLRKTLLVIQFTLAVFIFISALTVSKQVTYFFNKDLGYNKEQLLVITAFPKQWDSAGVLKMESIRDGLIQSRVVKSASMAFEVPDRLPPNTMDLLPEGGDKPIVVPAIWTDQYYASTFGLTMKEGSFLQNNFSTSASRQSEIVLNEEAVKALRLHSPVGSIVRMPNGFTYKVAGVVKDYNITSFQKQIGPLAFIPTRLVRSYRYLAVKLNTADISNVINEVKKKWQELSPGSPFEYTFMDDRYQSMFEAELKLKKATRLATVLNLFIVFMGIFGVVAFTLVKRTREIAVRKVLGADVTNIVLLFIKDYAPLIVIANIIAWPLAYMTTDHWLQNYAYRVQQNVVPYITVAVVMSIATFVFIAAQCYKTAISNPVKNLRTE